MAALTADKVRDVRPGGAIAIPVPVAASTTIYLGSIVNVNSSGYAVAGANDTSHECMGIAKEFVDNSAGSNGDLSVIVEFGQVEKFASTGITQADVGKSAYVLDSGTVGDDAAASKNVHIGTIVRLVATNICEIHVLPRPAVTAQPT